MNVEAAESGGNSLSDKECSEDLAFLADAIEYFDTHDLSDELANMPEVHFEISPNARRKRYPLALEPSEQLEAIASQRGISAEALLNEWVLEKLAKPSAAITLPPDLEQAVAAQARLRGITPEAAVLDALRERFLPKGLAEDAGDSLAEWERLVSAADDHIVASRAGD